METISWPRIPRGLLPSVGHACVRRIDLLSSNTRRKEVFKRGTPVASWSIGRPLILIRRLGAARPRVTWTACCCYSCRRIACSHAACLQLEEGPGQTSDPTIRDAIRFHRKGIPDVKAQCVGSSGPRMRTVSNEAHTIEKNFVSK